MFEEPIQELGLLVEGKTVEVVFKYRGDLDITSIAATCGCTTTRWDKDNKRIIITFTPSSIPHHLLLQGKSSYVTSKSVNVTVIGKGNFVLTFTGTVAKRCI